jgi:hypothetical protein
MVLEFRPDDRHPSRLALERWSVDGCELAERQWLEQHLAECQVCREQVAALVAFRDKFHREHSRAGFLAVVRTRAAEEVPGGAGAGRRWLAVPIPALVASAAALALVVGLLVWPGGEAQQDPTRSPERIKSSELELGLLVQEQGRVVVAEPGRVVHPGDRIQFRLSAPRGGYVHLISVDQAGQVSVYFPGPDETPEAYPGGSGRPVPGSVILDATLGRERVFALICDQPIDRSRLDGLIRSLAAEPGVWLERDRLPIDCVQTSLLLRKEP